MTEERQDAEQLAKHQEIIDILIAAGYYRARIKGLSPFDKIVGGLVYCLESLAEDVDVDLLFHDSLSIGQKIALTEKIVAVLPRLNCPYTIEPHQIQGLDFINIFPVVQWCVKQSVENRADRSEALFKFAVDQFENDFKMPSAKDVAAKYDEMMGNLKAVEENHRPKRKFKRKDVIEDEETRVRVTLMEYSNEAAVKSADASKGESVNVGELLSDLSLDVEKLEFDDETREAVFDGYTNLASEFSKDDKEIEYQRQVNLLKETKASLEKRLEMLKDENSNMVARKKQKQEELEGLKATKVELNTNLEGLKAKHSIEDRDTIEKLTALLQQTEELKSAESKFKQECNEAMQKMQEDIEKYEKLASADAEEENRTQLEVEKQNLHSIRLKLAKKNRQIVVLQRQLDNVPNRAELAQYQRRFLELYNQVSAKHRETKQFYTLYNTLSDKKVYMEKEIALLNSIYENFNATTGSSQLREQFLKQLEGIVVSVKENKVRVQKKCAEERMKKEKFSSELNELFEQQRKYAAAIKELKNLLQERQD